MRRAKDKKLREARTAGNVIGLHVKTVWRSGNTQKIVPRRWWAEKTSVRRGDKSQP